MEENRSGCFFMSVHEVTDIKHARVNGWGLFMAFFDSPLGLMSVKRRNARNLHLHCDPFRNSLNDRNAPFLPRDAYA